jgi:hypothetical protein
MTAIWVPTNVSTQTIGYNQRFLISDEKRFPPICYQTSKIEDTQPIGLTKLKFTQETYNPITDNYELMLADYYSSNIEPEVPDIETELKSTAAITYSGTKPTVKVGGSYKIFTPAFSDEAVTVSKWVVSDESGDISDDTNYTIEYDGDKLKLKVAQNYNLIGTILIVQSIGTDGSVAEVSVEVIG